MLPNIITEALRRHINVAERLSAILADIEGAAEVLLEVAKGSGKLLVCGNGGSAADAEHLAGEWVCRYKDDRIPLPAISLVNTPPLTAIGNDYGFEHIFSRQVRALGVSGDVLVAITTSGKSPNILRAIEEAKKRGLRVIALTGAKGRDLEKICDVAVVVPSDETARIQEMHELIYHAWCEYVDAGLTND